MADTSYPQPDIPANEPSIHARTPSMLDIIAHVETGNRNIPQQIHDRNTDMGTPANGVFQYINPTWHRYAPQAGVDVTKYPTAMSAPPSVQAQVASVTPLREWGPNTVAAVKRAYPNADLSRPPTGSYSGKAISVAPSSAPSATASTPPPTPTVGSMLAGLTQPTGSSGASQLQQAASDAGVGSQQQPEAPQVDIQGQQAAAMMGQGRQQQIAAQAQQMVASMLERGRQPLAWSGAPPGAGIGGRGAGQMVPGTTLNSIGDQYG